MAFSFHRLLSTLNMRGNHGLTRLKMLANDESPKKINEMEAYIKHLPIVHNNNNNIKVYELPGSPTSNNSTHRFRLENVPSSDVSSVNKGASHSHSHSPGPLVHIIFFDINKATKHIELAGEAKQVVAHQDPESIVWCSYGWRRDLLDVSDEAFEPRKNELGLRDGYLKTSLRRGARYVRWMEGTDDACSFVLQACFEKESQTPRSPSRFSTSQRGYRSQHRARVLREQGAGTLHGTMITEEEITESDIIIAVMGPTGAGKSTFIKAVMATEDVTVGHDLESCTSEIGIYRLSYRAEGTVNNVILIDTPGFDDTNKPDLEIFKMITSWLEQTYLQQLIISGVIYLHRISDNRMAGTPLRNLTMFQKLCGKNAFQKMTLVTTMWEDVTEEEGAHRESELKSDYWKVMLDKGATTRRFTGDRKSGVDIIAELVAKDIDIGPLRLQSELTELYKELPQTDAGRGMYTRLEALLEQQNIAMKNLQRDVARGETEAYRAVMRKEAEELMQQIQGVVIDMQYFKQPLPQRFYRLLTRLKKGE